MSNNCFIESIKTSLNNDSLPKLGVLRFTIPEASANRTIIFRTGYSSVKIGITSVNNRPFTVAGNSVTFYEVSYGASITFDSGKYEIEISNKYGLKDVNQEAINIFDNIDLSEYKYCPLREFTNIATKGDISELADITTIEKMTLYGVSGITGNLSSLGKLNQLTSLNVWVNTQVKGTVEEFVSAQYNDGGRLSCDTGINATRIIYDLSFKGKHGPVQGYILTWENETKIALYGGGTSIATSTSVYVSGYTAEEIAEKTASGGDWEDKTVINVDV